MNFFNFLAPRPLRRIVYISRSKSPFDGGTLARFCKNFSATNAVLHVSGMLIAAGGHFIQVLEGDSAVVQDLLRRITADSRHGSFRVLADEQIRSRMFGQWPMHLLNLDGRCPLSGNDTRHLHQLVTRIASGHAGPNNDAWRVLQSLPQQIKRNQTARAA